MHLVLVLDFLRNLAAHSHKAWMDEYRPRYYATRAGYAAFVEE